DRTRAGVESGSSHRCGELDHGQAHGSIVRGIVEQGIDRLETSGRIHNWKAVAAQIGSASSCRICPANPGNVKEKQMKPLHRVVAAGAVLAVGLCGWARAQVLEQVPSNAVGVFEVKDLQGLSTKIAKFAKALGIDQFDPRWADPLASVEDEMGLKQGVNKNGDLAIAFMKP